MKIKDTMKAVKGIQESKNVNEGQPVQVEGFTELLKTIYHEIDIRCISETENVSMTDIRKIFVKHGANEPDLW